MNIVLYYNKSERNKMDKTIEEVIVLEGNFRDSVSILRPRIIIELDDFIDFNYIYIEDLHRYYFVNNVVCVRNNIYLIECSVDVLMSYKEDILKQIAFVNRSHSTHNKYIKDMVIAKEPSIINYQNVDTDGCIKFEGYVKIEDDVIVDGGQYDNIVFSGIFTQAI